MFAIFSAWLPHCVAIILKMWKTWLQYDNYTKMWQTWSMMCRMYMCFDWMYISFECTFSLMHINDQWCAKCTFVLNVHSLWMLWMYIRCECTSVLNVHFFECTFILNVHSFWMYIWLSETNSFRWIIVNLFCRSYSVSNKLSWGKWSPKHFTLWWYFFIGLDSIHLQQSITLQSCHIQKIATTVNHFKLVFF